MSVCQKDPAMCCQDFFLTLSLPGSPFKLNIRFAKTWTLLGNNVNTTNDWKVLIESFHVSGHTFRFPWAVQDLEVFLGLVKFALAVKGLT